VTAQLASVDLRRGEYIVCPYSRTAKGTWVLDGKPVRLPVTDTTAEQLGEAIGAALAQSREGVEELTRDSQRARPLLDLLQLSDYATYAKGTRQVEVYRDGDTVEVTPQRNEGGRRGFTPIDTEMRTLISPSPDQFGTEVITAFTKAV
jgi:endonuclease YncB( thermonuclease family)